MSLLQRLYDPTTGTITVDGQDIAPLPPSFRDIIALVPQDPTLFNGSECTHVGAQAAAAAVGREYQCAGQAERGGAAEGMREGVGGHDSVGDYASTAYLHTVQKADLILMVEGGRVVDVGKQSELMERRRATALMRRSRCYSNVKHESMLVLSKMNGLDFYQST